MRITTLLVALTLTACGHAGSPLVEQREITAGTMDGLTIGMSRQDALVAAKRLGARTISPTPCNPFTISGAVSGRMPPFQGLEGVRLTDARGVFVDIYFSGDKVSAFTRSPVASALPAIAVGETIEAARESLLSSLRANSELSVKPIVNRGQVDVLTLEDMSAAAERMQAHRCWLFEINSLAPAGATYELTFGPGGIERVLYRRPRVRAD